MGRPIRAADGGPVYHVLNRANARQREKVSGTVSIDNKAKVKGVDMSFLHNVRVGFFGTETEPVPRRDLLVDECMHLISDFAKSAPASLQIETVSVPQGDFARGCAIGYASGHPIVLKAGLLICPCLSTVFILGSIAFAAFVHIRLGCSIYSGDDGRFLSLEEFIPSRDFSEIMQHIEASGRAKVNSGQEKVPGTPGTVSIDEGDWSG